MQFSSDSDVYSTSSSSQTASLSPNAAADILTPATPGKRKRGKSLSRRTGQDGHVENQVDGLWCDSGKTSLGKTTAWTFVSASVQSLALGCFPRANANGR